MDVWTLRRQIREFNLWLNAHPLILRVVELVPSGWGLVMRTAEGMTGCLEFHLDGERQGCLWNPEWVESPAESALGRAMAKRLHDARAGEARLLGFDRVVVVPFQQRDRLLGGLCRSSLILECTGRVANLLLVDETMDVVEQARPTANNRPGNAYQSPSGDTATDDPDGSDEARLATILSLPVSQWRRDLPWFSPLLCRELSFRLQNSSVEPVLMYREFLNELEGEGPVRVYQSRSGNSTLTVARLDHLSEVPAREFSTVNDARLWVEREVVTARCHQQLRDRALGHFLKRLAKLDSAVAEEQERLKGFDRAEDWRHLGDLLLANVHAIAPRSREARVTDWETGREVVIPLDPEATVAHAARRLFHRYRKSLRGQEEGRKRLALLTSEAAWVREQIWFCEHAAGVAELRDLLPEPANHRRLKRTSDGRREAREKQESKRLRPLLELDGCRYYVGRNGRQNDLITFRIGRKGDLWCHANDVPGAHVVVRRSEGAPTEQDAHRGAVLAAYFSFARQGGKVRVDVADVAYVKRIPGGDPGRVSYTHQRTHVVDPLEAENWLSKA